MTNSEKVAQIMSLLQDGMQKQDWDKLDRALMIFQDVYEAWQHTLEMNETFMRSIEDHMIQIETSLRKKKLLKDVSPWVEEEDDE